MIQSDEDWWAEMCKKHDTPNHWPTKATKKKVAKKKVAKKKSK